MDEKEEARFQLDDKKYKEVGPEPEYSVVRSERGWLEQDGAGGDDVKLDRLQNRDRWRSGPKPRDWAGQRSGMQGFDARSSLRCVLKQEWWVVTGRSGSILRARDTPPESDQLL